MDGDLCPKHIIRRAYQKGEIRIEEAGCQINHKWSPFRRVFVGVVRAYGNIDGKVVRDRICGGTTD